MILCLIAALGYLVLVSSQYLAYRLAEKGDWHSLRLAAHLEPLNAEYQYKLGRMLTLTQHLPDAAEAFGNATKLNPHNSTYWLMLASAQGALGDEQNQRQALQHAIAVDSKGYRVAWDAGNSYLTEGDLDSAFREFQTAIESEPYESGRIISLCWQAEPDVDALLEKAFPPNPGVYALFLEFLVSRKETAAAAKVWTQIVKLGQPTSANDVFDYVRYLIGQHEPEQAREVWQQAGPLCDLRAYQPSPENLVVNGDFSLKVLNAGFDLTYRKRSDLNLEIDPTQSHLGSRSLLITYDSSGLRDTGIYQLIPVAPNTTYHFSAYFKTQHLEGAGGPEFALQDFYTQKPYFASEDLKDSDDWKQVSGDFGTGPETGLLFLQIRRVPPGSAIRGKLWIDNVSLSPGSGQSTK
ncbi:MAG: carbohydrate binding domain-containing protein [Terriglobales bacterium]